MDDGHEQINEGWGPAQTHPRRVWPEILGKTLATGTWPKSHLQPSDYASPSSNQSSSSPTSYLGDCRVTTRAELNPIQPGSLTFSTRRHVSQSSSRHSFATFSSQESASDRSLRQTEQPLSPEYDYTGQRNSLQDNPGFEGRYDWQRQVNQIAPWPSPLPFHPMSPETSYGVSNYIAQPESAVQDNLSSNWSFPQTPFLSRFENHGILAHQLPNDEDFPLPCHLCNDPDAILQDRNDFKLHYWAKHAPPTGSPGAWSSTQCLWNSCALKKSFQTSKEWVYHARNVHKKRYRCDVVGCAVGPFGTQSMVDRHKLTKHGEPKPCIKAGCQARKGVKLVRKDKLGEHDAMWHGPLMCNVPSCPRRRIDGEDHGFSKQSELEKHRRLKHRHLRIRNSGT